MTYALTRLKTFKGVEGYGLNATITVAGVPLAFVLDDGNGGQLQLDFRNPLGTPASAKATQALPQALRTQREAAFYRWCRARVKTLPDYLTTASARDDYAAEVWINDEFDRLKNQQRFDRLAKTKTLFRLVGDSDETWRTLTIPYTNPKAQLYLDRVYPAKVTAIYGVFTSDRNKVPT